MEIGIDTQDWLDSEPIVETKGQIAIADVASVAVIQALRRDSIKGGVKS